MPLLVVLVALSNGTGELPEFDDLKPFVPSCCASHEALSAPLRSAAPALAACWDTHRGDHEQGEVRLQLLISEQGRAVEVYARGDQPELNACVVDVVWELEWPPLHCSAGVIYPVRFEASAQDQD